RGILEPYFYNSSVSPIYPSTPTLFLGISVLTIFASLETALIAGLLTLTTKTLQLFILRIMISLCCIAIASQIQDFSRPISPDEACFFSRCRVCDCRGTACCGDPYRDIHLMYKRIIETSMTTLFTFSDKGILLSANIMRPTYSCESCG